MITLRIYCRVVRFCENILEKDFMFPEIKRIRVTSADSSVLTEPLELFLEPRLESSEVDYM